jgi:hypothetical protein
VTGLVFDLSDDAVVFLIDTLATTTDGSPRFFTTKFVPLPHLSMVVCGTGSGGMADEWALRVNSHYLVAGIKNLNFHTPAGLRSLWMEHQGRHGADAEGLTTTVYHFGVSEDTGVIVDFAYRSTDDFVPERLQSPGLHFKPHEGCTDGLRPDETHAQLMRRMRAAQDAGLGRSPYLHRRRHLEVRAVACRATGRDPGGSFRGRRRDVPVGTGPVDRGGDAELRQQ